MPFAGFDCDAYPGDAVMQAIIQNTNLSWCGFYLGPAPSHGDRSWMGKLQSLIGMGFGLAPVYVGQQPPAIQGRGISHIVSATQGTIDGNNAADLAGQAGFSAGSIVFLDAEQGGQPDPNMQQYYQAWVAALTGRGFGPGVYCSHFQTAQALYNLNNAPKFWVFNLNYFTCDQNAVTPQTALVSPNSPFPAPDPTGSGVPFASLWQFTQTPSSAAPQCVINAGNQVLSGVDFDSSAVADPSNPTLY